MERLKYASGDGGNLQVSKFLCGLGPIIMIGFSICQVLTVNMEPNPEIRSKK
jgi:hypothetical protein